MQVDLFLLGIIIVSLLVVFLGYEVAFTLGVLSIVYLILNDFPISFAVQELGESIQNFTMLAIPLFMFAGSLMNAGKITDRIFKFANILVGRIAGGLGHVNIVASLIFAGMSGSILADVAGLGRMEYKAMTDSGYKKDFAIGVTLSSAAIGPILPPSVPLVLFGLIAEVSITGLFLGGILPAFLIALCLMIYVFFVGKKYNYYSYQGVWSFKTLLFSFLQAFPALLTPVIIVGGMTLGIFSPTEGAVVAVLYALLLSAVIYRDLTMKLFFEVSQEVVIGTTRLLFVISMALLFGWVLSVGRMPQELAGWIGDTFDSSWGFLLLLNISLLILGAIIENAILLLILAPMMIPIAQQNFGIDPIHLGVVMVFNIMIGQFTPPMGLSLFIMRDITNLSLKRISLAVFPFLIPLIVALLIMTFFPSIITTIPHFLGYGG